jgi:hypothetical protein
LAFLFVPVLLLKMPTQTAIIIGFWAIAVSKMPQNEKVCNALPHQNASHIDEIGRGRSLLLIIAIAHIFQYLVRFWPN